MFLNKTLKAKLMAPPRYLDAFILSVFTVLITLHPYFTHGAIDIFEVGLYLPGIQSILNGEIPYRDFFHLRGPFDLYMPAFFMKNFGVNVAMLLSYFYFGNVLCLILCIFIARELFKTRYILYLMAPVLVGRTFPRVVFTYWGGMRYALGLLSMLLMIKFFKKNKLVWIFGVGIINALASFTSIEMGVYPSLGILAALAVSKIFNMQDAKLIFKSFGVYLAGLCVIAIPYGFYLVWHSAFLPYVDSVLTVVTKMREVINPHLVSIYPRNFPQAFTAMTNPNHINFTHMTPCYLYIFILIYLLYQVKKKTFSRKDLMIVCLGVYGFVMYNTAFYGIWTAHFEMALQPEKILLFFLLEIFFLAAINKKEKLVLMSRRLVSVKWYSWNQWRIYALSFLLLGLFGSSIGYSIARYNHRFFAFKFVRDKISGKDTAYLRPMADKGPLSVNIKRARGIIIPAQQADELERIAYFVKNHVREDEEVFTYPELGTYNFLVDRRFTGRFPIATFAWFNDRWHAELMSNLKTSKPEYVILEKEIPQQWKDVYLALEPNRKKFRDVMDFISSNYMVQEETALSYIYRLK